MLDFYFRVCARHLNFVIAFFHMSGKIGQRKLAT